VPKISGLFGLLSHMVNYEEKHGEFKMLKA
jgi:hypothetical protein